MINNHLNNRLNSRTTLLTMLVVAFVFTFIFCTRSVAQQTPLLQSPQPPMPSAMQTVASDTGRFVRSGYLNLGLSFAQTSLFTLLSLSDLLLNYTAYLKWGILAEIGINARTFQGVGGHFLLGKTVLEHDGWRISPFLKLGVQGARYILGYERNALVELRCRLGNGLRIAEQPPYAWAAGKLGYFSSCYTFFSKSFNRANHHHAGRTCHNTEHTIPYWLAHRRLTL